MRGGITLDLRRLIGIIVDPRAKIYAIASGET